MIHRLVLAILLCVALVGGAVPAFAAGGQGHGHVVSASAHHGGHGMAKGHGACHDPAAAAQDTGPACPFGHADHGLMAGCAGGACAAPVLCLPVPLPVAATLRRHEVAWTAQDRRMTAQSIPPSLRPPRLSA